MTQGSSNEQSTTAPVSTTFNSSLANFYMSIPKNNMPAAAVQSSTASSSASVAVSTEPENSSSSVLAPSADASSESANPSSASARLPADERLKKRIKAHLQAQKKAEQSVGEQSSFDATKLIEYPTLRYSDFGGIDETISDIREVIERPFKHPEIYEHLGVDVPRGVLLFGPPGCGKTCLALAVAGELGVPLFKVSAPEIVSGMSGESEAKIRELFDTAVRMGPALIFIDEIDAITPKRENAQREMERRIVAQLLTSMDDLNHQIKGSNQVMVIGATNRPDSLDPALRRAGRFDREIKLCIPTEAGREQILTTLATKLRIAHDVKWKEMARKTPGYVGADLKALTREAAAVSINRIFKTREENKSMSMEIENAEIQPVDDNTTEKSKTFTADELEGFAIEEKDFIEALGRVQPSAKREGFAVVPNTTWDDIGALSYVREELRLAVVEPIRHPEIFASVGISSPAGVLLYGPPGCGKTLLAKAVANESHSNFISVKGPELLNKYVGESERAVRQVFERAAASAPCVIFFDEIDALCPRRAQDSGSDSSSSRIVNQLLTEMDGLEGRRQVYILAATNRPDILDPALTRPGRLDKALYVRLPSSEERTEILRTCGRKTPWHPLVDLEKVAKDQRAEGFSGADLAALVRESSLAAIRTLISASTSTGDQIQISTLCAPLVTMEHINFAFNRVKRSVSISDEKVYNSLRN
jgi:ribosome biogenesis ATPase